MILLINTRLNLWSRDLPKRNMRIILIPIHRLPGLSHCRYLETGVPPFYSIKTLHPCDTPESHGKQHPTPPHGRGWEHRVAREDKTPQGASIGPDLRERTPDLCTNGTRAPKRACRVPCVGPSGQGPGPGRAPRPRRPRHE
jgi:hypothetical protein